MFPHCTTTLSCIHSARKMEPITSDHGYSSLFVSTTTCTTHTTHVHTDTHTYTHTVSIHEHNALQYTSAKRTLVYSMLLIRVTVHLPTGIPRRLACRCSIVDSHPPVHTERGKRELRVLVHGIQDLRMWE